MTHDQLLYLKGIGIVEENHHTVYKIRARIETIEDSINKSDLAEQEKEQMCSFLHLKLDHHDQYLTTNSAELKLTHDQLLFLKRIGIVEENHHTVYKICAGIEKIEKTINATDHDLAEQDKEQICSYLRLKLEIDFKTLNEYSRHLPANQHHNIILFDHLCLFGVIKPVKIKWKRDDIDDVGQWKFGKCCSELDSILELSKLKSYSVVES